MSARPPSHRSRWWRWLAIAAALLLLLVAYAAALLRVTERIGDGVEDNLRDIPVLDDHTPRVN